MTDATSKLTAAPTYVGTNRLILGIVLAVVTFWLFAQTTLNVAPTMRDVLHITNSASNIAVSITALFSGIFIVVAGRIGRPIRPGEFDQYRPRLEYPSGSSTVSAKPGKRPAG